MQDSRKEIRRDSKGFPLLEDGTIDYELTAKEKQAYLDSHDPLFERIKKRFPTNYTPPKKKRKK